MNKRRESMGWVGAAVALTMFSGCATEKSEVKQGPPDSTYATPASGPMVTAEQNDAIDALFRRKAPQLQRCWQEEYERSQNRKLEGDITMQMMISAAGKAQDIKVSSSTIGVPAVDSCVTSEIASWGFPTGPAAAPYRRTVHLGPAF